MQHLWSLITLFLCAAVLAASPAMAQEKPKAPIVPSFQDARRAPAASIETDELMAKLKTAEARRAQAEAVVRRLVAETKTRIAKAEAARQAEEQRRRTAEAEVNRTSEMAQRAMSQIEQLRKSTKANESAAVAAAIARQSETLAALRKALAEARQQAADAEAKRKEEAAKRSALAEASKRQAEETRRIAEEAANTRKRAAKAEIGRKAAMAARQVSEQRAATRSQQAEQKIAAAEAQRKADEDRRIAAEAELKRQIALAKEAAKQSEASRKAEADRQTAAQFQAQRKKLEAERLVTEIKGLRKARQALITRHQQQSKALQQQRLAAQRLTAAAEQRAQRAEAALKTARAESDRRLAQLAQKKAQADAARKAAQAQRRAEQVAQQEKDRSRVQAARLVRPEEVKKPGNSTPDSSAGQAIQPAGIAVPVELPRQRRPETKACQTANVSATPLPGGRMQLVLTSQCRAGQRVTLTYAGVNFVRALDDAGKLDFILDCFAGTKAQLQIRFADNTSRDIAVVAQDLDTVTKIALIWQAGIDLDLHAYEYAAKHGARGHVWADASSSLEASQSQTKISARGRGFMSVIDNGEAGGDHVEVYTFWHKADQKFGTVMTAVDYKTRGDDPQGETCGKGEHAQVTYQSVIRTREGKISNARGTIAAMECGAKPSVLTRYIRAAVRDLRIR